jgi:hypothetical protein
MRLCEIIGDSEPEVYNKLRHIYFILNSTKGILPLEKLRTQSLNDLHEDKENLNYWILTSDRINKLYNEIRQLI